MQRWSINTSRPRRKAQVAIALATSLGLTVTLHTNPASASTITVDCGSGASLQAAIDAAAKGDTLVIKGTCTGNFVVVKNLTLQGEAGATLDGAGTGTTLKVFSRATVTGTTLTITGGIGNINMCSGSGCYSGGGVINRGRLTLANSTVSGNSAPFKGGGIFSHGSLTLISSTVSGNSASLGGGIFQNRSPMILTRSRVRGNSADEGGGILDNGPLTITNPR